MITVRRVALTDADVLLEWRNDAATRAASLNTAPVESSVHVDWLTRTIVDPDRRLYIGEKDGLGIGTVRFDRESEGVAEVSITIAPAHRGRGLSLPLLLAGIDAHAADSGRDERILARIRRENVASRALFSSASFHVIDDVDGVLLLERAAAPSVS